MHFHIFAFRTDLADRFRPFHSGERGANEYLRGKIFELSIVVLVPLQCCHHRADIIWGRRTNQAGGWEAIFLISELQCYQGIDAMMQCNFKNTHR